jgi:hypothetical protein
LLTHDFLCRFCEFCSWWSTPSLAAASQPPPTRHHCGAEVCRFITGIDGRVNLVVDTLRLSRSRASAFPPTRTGTPLIACNRKPPPELGVLAGPT